MGALWVWMHPKRAHPDEIVAQLAARQHGVVSVAQLYRAGLTPEAIKHRVRKGRLHRVHRGVYAVGRADLTRRGRWKAATLVLGEGAVLSHRSAAELWNLLEPATGLIDVTVPCRSGVRRRDGIRIHKSASLRRSDLLIRDAIPVTSPRRTIADLAGVLAPGESRNAIRAAEIANLPIGDYTHLVHRTRSELELIFLELIRRHGLPEPEANVRVGRFLVDFLWRAQRLVVETDGRRYHRGQLARTADLERDARLRARGFEVLRFGYWQVVNGTLAVIASVRARL